MYFDYIYRIEYLDRCLDRIKLYQLIYNGQLDYKLVKKIIYSVKLCYKQKTDTTILCINIDRNMDSVTYYGLICRDTYCLFTSVNRGDNIQLQRDVIENDLINDQKIDGNIKILFIIFNYFSDQSPPFTSLILRYTFFNFIIAKQ